MEEKNDAARNCQDTMANFSVFYREGAKTYFA